MIWYKSRQTRIQTRVFYVKIGSTEKSFLNEIQDRIIGFDSNRDSNAPMFKCYIKKCSGKRGRFLKPIWSRKDVIDIRLKT